MDRRVAMLNMKAKITSVAMVAALAIIIGEAILAMVPVFIAEDDWGVAWMAAVLSATGTAGLLSGIAAAGIWFRIVRSSLAVITGIIACVGIAAFIMIIDIFANDALLESLASGLIVVVSAALAGALLTVIIVVVATTVTRSRHAVQEQQYDEPASVDAR